MEMILSSNKLGEDLKSKFKQLLDKNNILQPPSQESFEHMVDIGNRNEEQKLNIGKEENYLGEETEMKDNILQGDGHSHSILAFKAKHDVYIYIYIYYDYI